MVMRTYARLVSLTGRLFTGHGNGNRNWRCRTPLPFYHSTSTTFALILSVYSRWGMFSLGAGDGGADTEGSESRESSPWRESLLGLI